MTHILNDLHKEGISWQRASYLTGIDQLICKIFWEKLEGDNK